MPMKAVVQDRYGGQQEVFELREIDLPEVGEDEVLVRVQAAGLHAGDVIVRSDDARMDSLPDLNDWKDTVERGDEFEMAVLREGEEVVLRGELPEPSAYLIFKRDVPSSAIRASFAANHLTVETSRVGAFRVLVHPDMVTLGQNLVIEVDGEVVFDEVVQPDIGFMLENYIENRDRSLLYVAEVAVDLE